MYDRHKSWITFVIANIPLKYVGGILMENRMKKIQSHANKNVTLRVIPGHFATNHSHINYYVDLTIMKSRKSEAEAAAQTLARNYSLSTYVDTIICLDGCQVIGAYLADALTESGVMSMNQHRTMYVVTPEIDPGGQLIFRDNMQSMIYGKHCLLLIASATTGRTIERAMSCVKYYGGIIEGISAIFSAIQNVGGMDINSIFSSEDLRDYQTYEFNQCPLCARKQKIDAIVNSYGYSRL